MSKVKKFYKTSIVYFLGRISSALITFALLPIYTDKILPDRYGYYEYIISILALIVPVLFFEMWFGVLRLSYDSEEDEFKNKIITTGLITICIPLVVFIVGFIIFSSIYNIDNKILIFFYVVTWVINLFLGMVARALQANLVFATSGIVGSLSNAAVGLVCVYIFKMQDEALFLAMIGSYLMQNIYIFVSLKLWRRLKFNLFDKDLAFKIFIFCLPFSINTIAYYLQNNYSKIIIKGSLGLDELGIFTVAGKFMVIVSLLASIFHLAWQETAFSLTNDEEKGKFYSIGINAFLKLTVWGCVLLLPAVKIMFPFMVGEAFQSAESLIPIYYIAVLTTTMSGFVSNILTAEKATVRLLVGKLVGCAFNLGIIYLFIDSIGIWAVIWGFIIGTAIELIVVNVMVKMIIDIKMDFKPLIYYIIFYGIGMFVFSTRSYVENIIWLLICSIVSILSLLKTFKELKSKKI